MNKLNRAVDNVALGTIEILAATNTVNKNKDKLALLPLIERIQDMRKVLRKLEKICNNEYNMKSFSTTQESSK